MSSLDRTAKTRAARAVVPAATPGREVGRVYERAYPSNQALLGALSAHPIQAKLRIGAVDDPLEREADRVAEAVVSGEVAPPMGAASPLEVQAKCAACDAKEETMQRQPVEEETLQTKPLGGAACPRRQAEAGSGSRSDGGMAAPPIVHDVLSSPGQPFDAATRAFFEPRFGYDLSQVRLHTDAKAAESARATNALAYTVGRDVVFGVGQYAPRKPAGLRLLAHELVHVLQQSHDTVAGRGRTVFRQSDEEGSWHSLVTRVPPRVLLQPGPTCWAASLASRRAAILGAPVDVWEIIDDYRAELGLVNWTQADGVKDFELFRQGDSRALLRYSISDAGGREVLKKEGLTAEAIKGAAFTNRFVWRRLGGITGLHRPFLLVGLESVGMAHVTVVFGVTKDTWLEMDPLKGDYRQKRFAAIVPARPLLVAS